MRANLSLMAHLSSLNMSSEFDFAALAAILLFLSLLGSGILLWVSGLKKVGTRQKNRESVSPWRIGWVNFGLFICALVISVFFTQLFAAKLISLSAEPVADNPELDEANITQEAVKTDRSENAEEAEPIVPTPWAAVLSVLLLQIPMIATFYGLQKVYPNIFGGTLNQKSVSISKAISETTPYFVRCFPIIWLTGLLWLGILTGLQKLNILDEFPPQQLVTILNSGGSFLAIGLLVVFAVLLAPFVEEIIFRGSIYRFLKGETSIFNAQFVSGAIFAVVHFNLQSFLPLLVIGVFLARVYEREGNILLPMIFHAYWNGFSLLMLFLTSQSELPFR